MPDSELASPLRRVVGTLRKTSADAPAVYVRHQFRTVLVFGVIVAVLVPALGLSPFDLGLVNLWLLYSVIAVGFYFIFAVAGQFALSQAFMAMMGGFASAYFSTHLPFVLSVLAGMGVTAVVALLFALVMRKVNGFYFAIATLSLAEVGTIILRNWETVGGLDGTRIGVTPPEVGGKTLLLDSEVFWLILGVAVLSLLAAAALERSPVRRELAATETNEQVAESLGVPVLVLRLSVFVFGSVLAALAGAVYAHWQGFMSIQGFGLDLGIGIFIMVLFGGTSSMWGSVIGAAFYVWAPAKLVFLSGYQDVFIGALIVIIIVRFPDGLIGMLRVSGDLVRRFAARVKQGRYGS